ncbi:Flp pilus assembly complex ATPase component TadA [bacterium]|nr:Flp pilus assembly complex ATPase component TadA [bacterium]
MSEQISIELEKLIMMAHSRGASDLHLLAGEPPTIRVDGVLERTGSAPLTASETKAIASAVVSAEKIDAIERDGGAVERSMTFGDVSARICAARVSGGISISVRLIPTIVPSVEMLRLPKGLIEAAKSPRGLIVCSGRIGSGKSTSAYGLLDHINATSNANIHTLEDPILYRLTPKKSLVQQREVGLDIPDTVTGLRQLIHMDPDVIFMSEVKTLEDLQAVITTAETGHLVIVIMHADSPEEAIRRIGDVFPEHTRPFYRKALADMIRCVSCQRLVPKIGGGRIAAFSVLVPDEEMRNAIAEGADIFSRRMPLPENCMRMADEINRMACEGIISEETAKAYLADM